MAYPQQRAPPVRNYNGRPPPRGGGAPPPDTGYNQGYSDYGYDNQYYGDVGYDAGYGYPPEQAVPRSQGPPRGAPRPPRGAQGPPMDDRGYAPSGRPPPRGYDSRRGHGDRRPPPPRERMGPPSRNGPMSPTSQEKIPWDNPFPSFPPKDQRRPAGIEGGMAAMNLNGPAPPRPHTSNGNVRRPPDAPRSAHPESFNRGPANPPGPPLRPASAGRSRSGDHPERSYTDPHAAEPMPHVNRSATMPVSSASAAYPGKTTYHDPRESTLEPNYTVELLDSYYNSAPDDPDMPNFDDMPDFDKSGAVIDENLPGLEQPKPKLRTEAASSSGGQYVAFKPPASDIQPQADVHHPRGPNQFANAGFQFDLPREGGYAPGMGYGYDDPYEAHSQGQYMQHGSRSQTMTSYPDDGGYMPHPGESPIHSNNSPQQYRTNTNLPPPTNGQLVNEPEVMDPQQNPDALPHHPVPFRPGLEQGAKPPPVRQYTSPPSSQPPAAVQVAAPNEPDRPQPVTHAELERLQQQARGNPSDHGLQLTLAKKMVEASTVLVDISRMDPKMKNKAREKYIMDAYKIVKKLVSIGFPPAQFYLADCYGQGMLGLQVDAKEAFNLYHSAAKQGHAQAAYRVAVCCEIGHEEGGGTKRDPFKAVQWYKRAAALGDPPAMYKMGMINVKGLLGQAKNPREGISWLKRAAERADEENPHALHELALMYANAGDNDVVIRDEAYALQLFHQAAELGYKFSQFRLGTAYEYGLMGCPVDPRQSIMLYSAAAAQGEHQSELALSGWYLTGCEGILQQSDTEAYLWARKAAISRLAKAEYAMGYFTEVGIGAPANLDDAKRWYWRAAAQGFPKARERLEELKKGGAQVQKTRLSRSAVNQQKQNDGDCIVM